MNPLRASVDTNLSHFLRNQLNFKWRMRNKNRPEKPFFFFLNHFDQCPVSEQDFPHLSFLCLFRGERRHAVRWVRRHSRNDSHHGIVWNVMSHICLFFLMLKQMLRYIRALVISGIFTADFFFFHGLNICDCLSSCFPATSLNLVALGSTWTPSWAKSYVTDHGMFGFLKMTDWLQPFHKKKKKKCNPNFQKPQIKASSAM